MLYSITEGCVELYWRFPSLLDDGLLSVCTKSGNCAGWICTHLHADKVKEIRREKHELFTERLFDTRYSIGCVSFLWTNK